MSPEERVPEDVGSDLPRDETERPPEQPPSTEVSSDDRMWAMFCHLSSILTLYLTGMGFLGPLIIWLIKKDQSAFVNYHGKEALNFQLTILIIELIGIATACIVVGIFILIGVAIYALIMAIIAGLNANSGQHYRYPATIRFIK
jgi:uncharacterized Tic20 family protein